MIFYTIAWLLLGPTPPYLSLIDCLPPLDLTQSKPVIQPSRSPSRQPVHGLEILMRNAFQPESSPITCKCKVERQ